MSFDSAIIMRRFGIWLKLLFMGFPAMLDIEDFFVFGGLAMIFYGVYSIYPPAAYIVVGGILVRQGIHGAYQKTDRTAL